MNQEQALRDEFYKKFGVNDTGDGRVWNDDAGPIADFWLGKIRERENVVKKKVEDILDCCGSMDDYTRKSLNDLLAFLTH